MSEMRLPDVDPESLPPRPPPPAAPVRQDGSLALGVGLAWLINVGGGIVLFFFANIFLRQDGVALIAIGWVPTIASIALAIWMIVNGPRRTGVGIFIGIGSIFAVSLLLVAACFGIVFVLLGR